MTEDIYKDMDILGHDIEEVPFSIRHLITSIEEEVGTMDLELSQSSTKEPTSDEHR